MIPFILGALAAVGLSELSKRNKPKMADGGGVGKWIMNDISNAKYLGIIEFQDNRGEYHNFEVMETEDRLVFGGMTNSGFIESGYIDKDGFTTDETLQELLSDLETYYNEGKEFTSMIVVNKRMASGGGVGKTYAELYNKIVLAVMKDIKVSREKAEDIVNENEGWLTDMIEYEGETNVTFLADQITTTDEGLYAKGGGVGEDVSKSLYVAELYDADGNIMGYTIMDKFNASGKYTLSSKKERAEEIRKYLINNPSRLAYYRKNEYAKGGGVGYTEQFEEVADFGNEQYYIRKWGKVSTDKKDNVELLAVANIKDLEDYMSEEELPKEGNFQLDITLVPIEKHISKKHKSSANDDSVSMGGNTIVNIVSYMGGLNYEPQEKVFFKTFDEAHKYLMSKQLNDKISSQGMMSGFILDKAYNRIGQTNWDYLSYMMGETERFAKGGGVGISHYKVGDEVFIDYMDAVNYCDKHNLPYEKIVKTKKK